MKSAPMGAADDPFVMIGVIDATVAMTRAPLITNPARLRLGLMRPPLICFARPIRRIMIPFVVTDVIP